MQQERKMKMIRVKKSILVAGVCVVIAIGMLVVVVVNPQKMQDFFGNLSAWIRNIFHGEREGSNDQGNGGASIVEFVYKPFNAMPYIDQDELSEASDILEQISTFIDRYFSSISIGPNADGCAKLVDSNSPTVRAVAYELVAFYPNNREFQAKEIYYWVSDWISYDHEAAEEFLSGTQRELPVQTINDKTGVCVNYAVVLASLYEAAGFDAKIVVVWNGDWPWEWSNQHALLLLYYPGLDYAHYFDDGWMVLDPTAGSIANWEFGEYHPQGYDHYDIADV